LKVAGEYAPQRYLIGPTLYPYYLQALQVVAAVVCVLHVVVSLVVGVTTGDLGGLTADTVGRIVDSFLVMGAFVTIGFAVMEGRGHRAPWIEHWNPLSLRHRGASQAVDRGDLITSIVTDFVGLLWWNGALALPTRIALGDTTLAFARSPAWDAVFWPVNAVLVGSLVLCAAMLWVGHWRGLSVALKLAVELAAAALVIYLLRAPTLVLLEGAAGGELETVRMWVDVVLRWTLWFVLAVVVYELIQFGRMALRLARIPADAERAA
jgi:hypothetical protein